MGKVDRPETAVDSSVIVAALLPWHEHHSQARSALVKLARGRGPRSFLVPLAALVESYSVITRLPAPNRLSADDAYVLLAKAFQERAAVTALGAEDAWEFLAAQRDAGVCGGAIYDAVILAGATQGGARRLLTVNRRHFDRLPRSGLEIIEPSLDRP